MTEPTPADIPDRLRSVLDELTPGDVGTEEDGLWVLRFEGFSGLCLADVTDRMALPETDPRHISSLDDALSEVRAEFAEELGPGLVEAGILGDDEPVVYAIGYRDPAPDPGPS